MDKKIEKAFEFAKDTTKQLITLATGIITLEITFSKEFIKTLSKVNVYASLSWLSFLVSVFFGVWTLMALTGTLEAKDESIPVSIRGFNVLFPSILQIISFIFGLIFTVVFGVKALNALPS